MASPVSSPKRRARALWFCAALLTACGAITPAPATPPPASTPGPNTPLAIATAPASASAPTPADTTTPVATPAPTVFTLGLVDTPGALDPANAVDESALLITRHLYDGLTAYQPGATLAQPALAESWDVSSDGLAWTFLLRRGVFFSDGAPLTADVARLNFQRWLQGTPPGGYLFWRAMFGGFAGEAGPAGEPLALIQNVTTRGDATLVLTLSRTAASLPNTLAMPSFALISAGALDSADITAGLNAASAGTGPYVLAEWPRPDLVRLQHNADHPRGQERA